MNFFNIKSVTLTGPFNVTGDLNLYSGRWENLKPANTAPVYEMYKSAVDTGLLLDADLEALSTKTTDNGLDVDENYLMMLPTSFATNKASLTVVYTITTNAVVSTDLEKTVEIDTNFEQGKAYVINLTLQLDPDNQITFDVSKVEDWDTATTEITSSVYGTNPVQ